MFRKTCRTACDERLQLARQQLERGLVSITEAAYEAGYLHPSNFTAAFKKAFGISPQAFLEQKQPVQNPINR
ncbi:hypothetical protein XV94_13605 [Vibrio metoecus]|nr:hypothetical protein XV94_13605 [Vibrio metoecus]